MNNSKIQFYDTIIQRCDKTITERIMDYKMIEKSVYAGKIHSRQYNITIDFFTKKQMKSIYSNKNYRIVGEIGNTAGVQCATVDNTDGNSLPVYKENTHNIFTECVKGYAAVDDHTYLAVVKNVLVKRVLIYGSILVLIGTGIGVGFISHLF